MRLSRELLTALVALNLFVLFLSRPSCLIVSLPNESCASLLYKRVWDNAFQKHLLLQSEMIRCLFDDR